MSNSEQQSDHETTTTSTGHNLADGAHLDGHFEIMRAEYEEMVRSVGIQRGWHILDAGAGGGSFLRQMSDLVGPSGQIDALDLAPENVLMMEQRVGEEQFACPIKIKTGSITELPYDDNQFDLVWCANVSQYLSDDEMTKMLREMFRVTHPGGLVVIRDVDIGACRQFAPLDQKLFWHILEAADQITQIAGLLRVTLLPRWFRNAGFSSIKYETFCGERQYPIATAHRDFMENVLRFWGNLAIELGLPEAELVHWRRMLDPKTADYLLNDPEFYWRETWGLVTGMVPEG